MKKLLTLSILLITFFSKAQCPPHISASMLTQTLTCYDPTILATGSSTTASTIIHWIVPPSQNIVTQPTLVLGPPNGPQTSTATLVYASYTVVATNTAVGSCQSTSVITISQNFKPPISSPTISISSPTAIYCSAAVAPPVLTAGNSTTTSGGGPTSFVSNPCWSGPSPQTPTCGPASYSCYVPGIYSLQLTDNYNGCTSTGTVNVADRTQPPVITNPVQTMTFPCSAPGIVTLNIALTGTTSGGVRTLIYSYPSGSSFSPPGAVTQNMNPLLSGTSSNMIQIGTQFGNYNYAVTNTLTGCYANGVLKILPNDNVGFMSVAYVAPSCSACCNGTMTITPPNGFTSYSTSVTQGTLVGNPATAVTNLCYGPFKYCFTNTSTQCKWCDSVVVNGTVSIPKIKNDANEFVIYPNPTNSNLFIRSLEGKTGLVKIFNIEGKEIESLKLESERETEISNLQSGIYFVEVNIEGVVTRKKVVVIK